MTTLRSDAARNRERVIAAAEEVFAEHGLEAGVEEIAQRAGVGVGTLYRRFPTKDALIAELVRELLTRVLDEAHAAREAPSGTGLELFLYATAEAQARHRGCLARLWDDEPTAQLRAEIRTAMARLLAQAQEHGEIRADAAAGDLDLIFWSLPGVIETTDGLPQAWRRHLALMLAGLRPSGTPLADPALSTAQVKAIRNRRTVQARRT
jgi:AcrR family transcriptional regulator